MAALEKIGEELGRCKLMADVKKIATRESYGNALAECGGRIFGSGSP